MTGEEYEDEEGEPLGAQLDNEMIFGSPEAERYFERQHRPPDESALAVRVDDLSGIRSSTELLVVRPLSSPDNFRDLASVLNASSPVAPEVPQEPEEAEEADYTESEDAENQSQAAARVASLLNDLPRDTSDPLDNRADRMAEAILASAMFETVFLQQPQEQQPDDGGCDAPLPAPFIGSSLCRIRIPNCVTRAAAGAPGASRSSSFFSMHAGLTDKLDDTKDASAIPPLSLFSLSVPL